MTMDLSSIIVAIVSGVFSVLVIILQKGTKKVDKHIEEQTTFLNKSKVVTQQINDDRRKIDELNRRMLQLILDTNIMILDKDENQEVIQDMINRSIDLKADLAGVCDEIEDLEKERQMIEELTEHLSRLEINKR